MEVDKLKKDYDVLAKKYKLPSFDEVNGDFEIGKIDRDCGTLLRTARKMMMEKVVNSMGFAEMLLNPVNAPRIYFGYLKNMTQEDKNIIEKLYKELAELSVDSLECEVVYSEKREADMIKKVFLVWNNLKGDFSKILHNMKNPSQNSVKRERSYFG